MNPISKNDPSTADAADRGATINTASRAKFDSMKGGVEAGIQSSRNRAKFSKHEHFVPSAFKMGGLGPPCPHQVPQQGSCNFAPVVATHEAALHLVLKARFSYWRKFSKIQCICLALSSGAKRGRAQEKSAALAARCRDAEITKNGPSSFCCLDRPEHGL